jgi:hypothetical protein
MIPNVVLFVVIFVFLLQLCCIRIDVIFRNVDEERINT